jgi:hypothetical protein
VRKRNEKKLIVAIYGGDGLIAGSGESEITVFLYQLSRNSKITKGTLSNFLGMQIDQRQDGIYVCHRVYAEKVLERFKMHEANPVATPCGRSSGGTKDSVRSHVPYREAVSCLMYLMTGTHPDIG